MIKFNSKHHSYEKGSKTYTSVSQLIAKYKEPFKGDHYSYYKAYELFFGKKEFKALRDMSGFHHSDPKLIEWFKKLVPDEQIAPYVATILKEWETKKNTAIKKGNDYHTFKEHQTLTTGVCFNPYTNKEFNTVPSSIIKVDKGVELRESSVKSLIELEDGFHPECLLWNDEVGIAGQADKVFIETINGVRYVDIDDYKTNKKIDTYNPFKNKMKDPISHLDCCNYNHYRLQISAYAWLLEQAGYKVRYLGFTHLNKPYRFEYLKKEIDSIMPTNDLVLTLKQADF